MGKTTKKRRKFDISPASKRKTYFDTKYTRQLEKAKASPLLRLLGNGLKTIPPSF